MTTPELCETQFSYDGSGRLQTRISPASSRTTYSYDGSSRVTNVTFPDGNKTTYSYSGDNVSFTDQRGKVTTLMHSADKLLQTVIDPNGKRTTLTWTGKLLQSVQNPLGKRTTFSYKTFSTEGV